MVTAQNKLRQRILTVLLVLLTLWVTWDFFPVYSGEKVSYIKIDTNGVPRWHGISLANTNSQAIVFRLLKLGNYKVAVTFENERKQTASGFAALIQVNSAVKKAGLRPSWFDRSVPTDPSPQIPPF